MIEKWKKSIDQRKNAGALLTVLSKAFDCILHNLLIAKLEAYGVDTNSLYIMHSYLIWNTMKKVENNMKYNEKGLKQYEILWKWLKTIWNTMKMV